jgi:hypothetical protein
MADLDEVERALATTWDREQLAVYGDYLQAKGDPRGEMIAIDLHAAEHEYSEELQQRKRELVMAWLGDDLATILADAGAVREGFVELDRAPVFGAFALGELLEHPAGRFLRSFAIRDTPKRLTDALSMLADWPRPWLRKLEIEFKDAQIGNLVAPIDNALAASLVGATPNLVELSVRGAVFDVLAHPRVTALRIDGFTSIAQPEFPSVRALELSGAESAALSLAVLRRLPALRRLHVPVRSDADIDTLERVVAEMPSLVELEVIGFLPSQATRAPRVPDSIKLTYTQR